ncbi:mannan polymerase complexes MNN9 subunit [Pseudomassariella vexata]|uniref:Mannan polymerase complexes MNN9 subunit n=1 Tax=Pseudomassariella vexata TaxID=1141098 RepID=A0A1Y2E695_9PEZI|nr:mannan polymerase complexes MNN9 subunit [Pseudomassariella vexata]ORY66395.1 mannan polymerase complexes MNN9 subunit [Pseudomassariella vexata]
MARPMGPVRLRRTNYVTLSIGAALCIFIIYFLTSPGGHSRSTTKHSSPIPKPSHKVRRDVQRFDLNKVTITNDPVGNKEKILILTPMARFYQEYWDNLVKLNYPHELITLGFILPKSKEGNAATTALQAQITKTQKGARPFRKVIIERQDFEPPLASQDESERHKLANQKDRRAAMSKARNSLLFTTLGPDTSWVLWLDADIVETPPTLIQDLASHNKDLIVPNCFQRYTDDSGKLAERAYDFNSWQDSNTAQELAATMGPEDLLLEGYEELPTYRTLMAYMELEDMNDVRAEVPLDGVGGTALLVKADVHRDGAMFPPFPFYHLIETEGFAKMARRLGWHATGLPNYKVYHYNE